MANPISVFWFRRDLRLDDNAALSLALSSGRPVLPIFIFDPHILNSLARDDARVTFIHATLTAIRTQLETQYGSSLAFYHGKPLDVFQRIFHAYQVTAIYANHDYEPYARTRDEALRKWLQSQSVDFHTCKDLVIFEKNEISKTDGRPYTLYTPYQQKWKAVHCHTKLANYSAEIKGLVQQTALPYLTLADIGFHRSSLAVPPYRLDPTLLRHYEQDRNFPAMAGTSRLGPHLRFGTVSIRKIFQQAQAYSDTFCNELIWREFFSQILWHFPHTEHNSFKSKFDLIQWRNNETEFRRWCEGTTGYPLVDAGMRELNATGYMHNRVRMITASFLCKHLLIDWRWGEAYFASKLLDYDMASNVGNWQWVAGCGTDAAPYFRIFNPIAQAQKFDKNFDYIRTWVSEWNTGTYPAPMVDHKLARERCLNAYRQAVS